jgi:uncharacterized protein YbjT (DUF2867 family)
MKIIVTGSLGHISKPLTIALIQQGHAVTVISSNPEKQKDIQALGAIAAIGSIEDIDFLTTTFTGADAVYTMLPPPNFTDHGFDLMAHSRKIAGNYKQAIEQSGVKRVVHLSSIGAHLEKGSGLILFHRAVEDILNKLSNDIVITFMRPVGFYYNLLAFIGGIKASSIMASNYGADDIIPWVSPIDIATAIAEEIVTPLVEQKVRYVASEEISCNDVARILGTAISKPDLQWILITDQELQNRLESFGINKVIAAGLVEMQANMHSGPFYDDYYRNKPVLGNVKLTDFAKEFTAAFNQNK